MKDNADLKAHSVPPHVNPSLENGINKLITQYFCTCVIPFVVLKYAAGGGRWDPGVGGGSRCAVGQSRERWVSLGISLSHCVYASVYVSVWVHVPASIFNVYVLCVLPGRAAGVLFLNIGVVTVIVCHSLVTLSLCDSSSRHRD